MLLNVSKPVSYTHLDVYKRQILRELGGAHVTALASRPKLIGGARALYLDDPIRKS